MIAVTLLVVCVLRVIDLGSLRWAAVGLVPLFGSLADMRMRMAAVELKLNFILLVLLARGMLSLLFDWI